MTDINIEGTVLSRNVVETVICMAATEVEGIASVGGCGISAGMRSFFGSQQDVPGIELETGENGGLFIGIHLELFYGYVMAEVADKVRERVAFSVETQLGAKVDQVDVYVDGIRFAE